jgi:hypothetical protein
MKNDTLILGTQIVLSRRQGLENTAFALAAQVFRVAAKIRDQAYQSFRLMGIQLIGDKMVRFIAWMPINQVTHKMGKIVFGACVSAMTYDFASGDIEARNQGLVPCRRYSNSRA